MNNKKELKNLKTPLKIKEMNIKMLDLLYRIKHDAILSATETELDSQNPQQEGNIYDAHEMIDVKRKNIERNLEVINTIICSYIDFEK